MPLPPGARFRVKKTKKGPVRLAFMGKKVVEASKMRRGKGRKKPGSLRNRMSELRMGGSFDKGY